MAPNPRTHSSKNPTTHRSNNPTIPQSKNATIHALRCRYILLYRQVLLCEHVILKHVRRFTNIRYFTIWFETSEWSYLGIQAIPKDQVRLSLAQKGLLYKKRIITYEGFWGGSEGLHIYIYTTIVALIYLL